jgi:hypothetical protein
MPSVKIYYNKDCSDCRKIAAMHRRFDWFRKLETSTEIPPTGPLQLGQIAIQNLKSGEFVSGVEGFRLICRQVPLYLPFVPLTYLPFIAKKYAANIVGCQDDSCSTSTP